MFSFAFLVLLAIVLTKLINGSFPEQNMIKEYFGANNICLYFDYEPVIYVLPPFWAITCVAVAFYCAASVYRYRIAWAEKKISHWQRKVLCGISVGFFIATCGFSLCFAIQPTDHKTMLIHTLPFTNLIFWQIMEQGAIVFFGFKGRGWTDKDGNGQPYLPFWYKWASLTHWIILALHGFCHIGYQVGWFTKILNYAFQNSISYFAFNNLA